MSHASRLPYLLIVLLSLGSSVTSLGNGFTLDDVPIVLQNDRVHSLTPAAYFSQTYWPPPREALYRPLTIMGYALQWQAGDGAPVTFHLANVLLYILASTAVLWLGMKLLPRAAALLAAALFAIHPVHVEAVGNVIGQPEIVVAALIAFATGWYVRARRKGQLKPADIMLLAGTYAIALLFKEHAVMLPALLILAEWLLVEDRTPLKARMTRLAPMFVLLAIVVGVLWAIRSGVTGGLVGQDIHPVFRDWDGSTRILTMLGVVPIWIRLFLFPLHLSADYNPQQVPVVTEFSGRALWGAALLILLVIAAWRMRRRQPMFTFGVLWTGISLFPVSNILIPTGILLAERTLFLPSVGVVLALGGLAATILPQAARWPAGLQRVAVGGVALLLLIGMTWSSLRQRVWKDNPTLFTQTAMDAPRNYKALVAHAVVLLNAGNESAGEREYLHGLSLYPYDPNLYADLGNWYLGEGRCDDALKSYSRVLELAEDHWEARSRSILCYIQLNRLVEARAMAETAVRRGDEGAARKLSYVESLIARSEKPKP